MWKRLWFRFSGFVVCAIAIVLPYRARLFFGKTLNFFTNPLKASAAVFMAPQLRFWNKIILRAVFWLGFPPSKLLLILGTGRSRMAPPTGSATYWVPRETPEVLDAGIGDPF